MGNYNFSIRGINKKIGELVDEVGLYLPEKLRPIYQTVVDAMSRSKDKGLGYITQPLANALSLRTSDGTGVWTGSIPLFMWMP